MRADFETIVVSRLDRILKVMLNRPQVSNALNTRMGGDLMDLFESGLPFTAREAEAWGLVNRVVEPADLLETTLGIARRMAENGPLAVRQAKQAIHRGLQMSVWDGLALPSRSRPTIAWSEPKTAAKACSRSMNAENRCFGDGEVGCTGTCG
jgi:enoyl-CoA hydratase/carnithine racemase